MQTEPSVIWLNRPERLPEGLFQDTWPVIPGHTEEQPCPTPPQAVSLPSLGHLRCSRAPSFRTMTVAACRPRYACCGLPAPGCCVAPILPADPGRSPREAVWASRAAVSVAPRFFCLSFQSCWEQPIICSIMEIIPFKATGAFFSFGGVGGI